MRNMSKVLAVGALLAMGSTILIAADSPATAPAAHMGRAAKLTKPYSDMTDLTADQKTQIIAIHQKANEDRDAINRKEREDIQALLSDDQKKELADIEAKIRADEAAKRHHNNEPTTKPAT